MNRKDVLTKLLAQHATLRALMDECDMLIAEAEVVDLERVVARLSLAFDAHNHFEESVLVPILVDTDAFDAVRLARMMSSHESEHRTLHERLRAPEPGGVLETVAILREHLDAEERYFLSARVVRDDLVVLEGGA
jgi:hypothetical protein